MRIVGNIKHPSLKITVFQNEGRFSVKMEDGGVAQTYKFNSGQGVESFRDVERYIDAVFLQKIEKGIAEMQSAQSETLKRNSLEELPGEFEEII